MSIENNFKPETHTKKKRQNCMNYKQQNVEINMIKCQS